MPAVVLVLVLLGAVVCPGPAAGHQRRSSAAAAGPTAAGPLGGGTGDSDRGERRAGFVLPIDRPVTDRFRRPLTDWGPGNRGWEFATVPGDPVVSVGPGTVVFAGPVAGRGVVTVAHAGGLRSSVTGLVTVDVRAGQVVEAGTRLGGARAGLHLGFRRGGRYIDPAAVFGLTPHAVLVPLPRRGHS